jgi:hypothetical protein
MPRHKKRLLSVPARILAGTWAMIGLCTSISGAPPTIYGAAHIGREGDSILYTIDPQTGVATAVGNGIGFERISGMAFDPVSQTLYATGERLDDTHVLIAIDRNTGIGAEIGATGVAAFSGIFAGEDATLTDISFRPSDLKLFGFSYPGQWVAAVDIHNGTATQLAFESKLGERGILANDGNGLAFLPGNLLVHAGSDGPDSDQAESCAPNCESALHEINLATNQASTLVGLNFPVLPNIDNDLAVPRVNGMDFDPASGMLFASVIYKSSEAGPGNNFFATVDPATGNVNLIGATIRGMDAIAVEKEVQRFRDVPPAYWAYSFIETLATSGITAGCGNDNYCPLSPVTRAQMAVFLERGMRGSDYSPPVATGNVFSDVSAQSFAANFIEQFSLDGITSGCGNNNYCPDIQVTRDQMAVFLLRAKHGAGYSPPPASGVFADVPLSHWAVHWIEQLAAEGITSGCGTNTYCPGATVTRDQMAVFLVRTFGL